MSTIARLKRMFGRLLPAVSPAPKKASVGIACPEGYEPVSAAIAGIRYQQRAVEVAGCTLREFVWLRREPQNRHDPNAVRVVNSRGRTLGYLPRELAAKLAAYMDAGHDPIKAMITELASDVAGDAVGARVGFFLPAAMAATLAKGATGLAYHCEPSSSGALYLLLDGDETLLHEVAGKLQRAHLRWVRHGVCYRPASDGRKYRWYILLEEEVGHAQVDEFFYTHFGVKPPPAEVESDVREWLDTLDEENANLTAQNTALRSKVTELEAEILALRKALSQREVEQRAEARRSRSRWKEEFQHLLQLLLPELEFLRNSVDVLLLELEKYDHVLRMLHAIVRGQDSLRAKHLKGVDGWREAHFSTGQKDEGRLYFRKAADRWLVLVSFKESQKRRDIPYLQKYV